MLRSFTAFFCTLAKVLKYQYKGGLKWHSILPVENALEVFLKDGMKCVTSPLQHLLLSQRFGEGVCPYS